MVVMAMKMSSSSIFLKLRRYNKKNYKQLLFCTFFSIFLVTSFVCVLYSPVVQAGFPEGGDSLKMIMMIFALAVLGCLIFNIYAAGLFFRTKSRETGVFLALGMSKKRLKKELYKELCLSLGKGIISGIVLGVVAAVGILWILLHTFLKDILERRMFSAAGLGISLFFAAVTVLILFFMAARYMRRTNLMDILNEEKKNEPLQLVKKGYGIAGGIFLVVGLLFGYTGPQLTANLLKFQMPAIWNAVYLVAAVGIYMLFVFFIVYHKRGKQPQKYYHNLISNSMMKFQGRQTVRNMCILAFLTGAALYAGSYIPDKLVMFRTMADTPVDFNLIYRQTEQEIQKEDIEVMADEYGVTITDYQEVLFAELQTSGVERDWTDDGKLIEDYYETYAYGEFISASVYEQYTGTKVEVEPGTFAQIILPEQTENFWEKYTDMDLVTNQETGAQLNLKFAKTVEDRMFYRANVHRYILNDSDFQTITAQMTEQRQMKQIFFDVEESENVYDFAIELRKEYVRRAGKDMAVLNAYNEAEEDRAEATGEPYHYRMTEPMDPEDPYLYHDWKFNPEIQPIQMKTYLHESGIMILTFLYVSCICLAAIGIIAYTRSVTIGVQNQKMFDDLRKLGAKNTYIMRCIKNQLRKIFVLPTAIGLFLILSFLMIIYIGNDKRIQSTEWMSFGCTVGFAVIICIYQLIVYRMSLKKLREILKL